MTYSYLLVTSISLFANFIVDQFISIHRTFSLSPSMAPTSLFANDGREIQAYETPVSDTEKKPDIFGDELSQAAAPSEQEAGETQVDGEDQASAPAAREEAQQPSLEAKPEASQPVATQGRPVASPAQGDVSVEEMSWEHLQLVRQRLAYCSRCKQPVEGAALTRAARKSHCKLSCKACHNTVTMLYKNWGYGQVGLEGNGLGRSDGVFPQGQSHADPG